MEAMKKAEPEGTPTLQVVTRSEVAVMLNTPHLMRKQILDNWQRWDEDTEQWASTNTEYVKGTVYARPRDPEVGMGVTIHVVSDKYAGTIEKVSPSLVKVWIRIDKPRPTKAHDFYGKQSYLYVPDPEGEVKVATRRPSGVWKIQGAKGYGQCVFGVREFYSDQTF